MKQGKQTITYLIVLTAMLVLLTHARAVIAQIANAQAAIAPVLAPPAIAPVLAQEANTQATNTQAAIAPALAQDAIEQAVPEQAALEQAVIAQSDQTAITHTTLAQSDQARESRPDALILYTTPAEGKMPEIAILDMLVGQFAGEIVIADARTFDLSKLDGFTHVLYFGQQKENLAPDFIQAVEEYEGSFFAIGFNAEQFKSRYSFYRLKQQQIVTKLRFLSPNVTEQLLNNRFLYEIELAPGGSAEILAKAVTLENKEIPYIARSGNTYLCLGDTFFEPFGKTISEALNDFFGSTKARTVRYLRLEDVHPKTDPARLMEIAVYLAEKNIPYMVAVIPVYCGAGNETRFSDVPELVTVLRYMQDHGASIVLHGYRHQFRDQETGEGFEFWDSIHDRPIYQGKNDPVFTRDNFSTNDEYLSYVSKGEEYERRYIEDALAKGVQELTAYKLYPLAFEAPHYAMSRNGYKTVSERFNAYVGELQLSDDTWTCMEVTPFYSRPNMLNGMSFYPETVGFVPQGDEIDSIRAIQEKIQNNQLYTRAYISAFYHSYLGLDYLKQIVESLERVEGAVWLDLKQENLTVNTGGISIYTENGRIVARKKAIASVYEMMVVVKSSAKWFVLALWGGPFLMALLYAIQKRLRAVFA